MQALVGPEAKSQRQQDRLQHTTHALRALAEPENKGQWLQHARQRDNAAAGPRTRSVETGPLRALYEQGGLDELDEDLQGCESKRPQAKQRGSTAARDSASSG